MGSFPEMYNDLFLVISGPEKSPLQTSRPSRFSCRASNFSYSLASWVIVQAIHLYFKLKHHLTQACNISGASKMFKLLVLRTSWNSSFLFKHFHFRNALLIMQYLVLQVSKNWLINQKNKNPISSCQHQNLTPDWNNTHLLFTIYMGKLFSSQFGQKLSKLQGWLMLFQNCEHFIWKTRNTFSDVLLLPEIFCWNAPERCFPLIFWLWFSRNFL